MPEGLSDVEGRFYRRGGSTQSESNDTTAVGPPNPDAVAMLRRIARVTAPGAMRTLLVGKGSVVFTFGGTRPAQCDAQLRTIATKPAAPRLWPRAPLCE